MRINYTTKPPPPDTVEGWLKRIADPIVREQALANVGEDNKNISASDISSAILYGFEWDHTPEGNRYWSDQRKKYL